MTINGVKLDDGQAMTVRVAIESFAEMVLNDKELFEKLGEIGPLYRRQVEMLRRLIALNQVSPLNKVR
jgi:hypothetical protein